MPKDKNNGREMTPDEKFRSFFSTTAVDIPEEMTRRDENQPEEKPQKRFGLFGRGKEKQETDEAAAEQPQEMPTGEVRLGEDAQPEPEADLELMLKPEADPEQELAPWPFLEKEAEDAQPEAPAKKPEKKSAPQTAEPPAAVKPKTPRQSAVPAARPAEQHSTAKPLRHPKNAPEVLLPQEEQEQQYQAMKRRIKYMYEAGTGSATVEKVLSSGNTIHAVKNNVSVCMCRIIMPRKDGFIALTKIFFRKFSDDLESSPRFHIFFLKRNDDVIPLPFICLSKLLLCCKHLVKCLFRLTVNARHITHILRLVRIYNIGDRRLQMPPGKLSPTVIDRKNLSDSHSRPPPLPAFHSNAAYRQ